MDKTEMTELLKKVADGIVSPEEAALKLKMQPFMEIGEFAKVDFHRGIRQGVPEVIYGEGKTKDEVKELGYFGKVENEVITFPTNMLLIRYIDIPNTGWYWANLTNTFKLVLPEGS